MKRSVQKHYPEMITSSSQLVIGMTLWHIHGHIRRDTPHEEVVVRLPYKVNGHSDCFDVVSIYGGRSHHFCGDVGLDGVNYNLNRLFTTKEAAADFHKNCTEAQNEFDAERDLDREYDPEL
jgi:hypothetical protein